MGHQQEDTDWTHKEYCGQGFEHIAIAKLDHIIEIVTRAHHSEMRKIDTEISELGAQIAAITDGEVTAEQIDRLRGIATRLDAVAKLSTNSETERNPK